MLILERKVNYPKLRGAIAERNIKQKELAALWGVSRQTVSNKVKGIIPINEFEAKTFSNYAKLSCEEKLIIFSTPEL